MPGTIFIVANRLPVTVGETITKSAGGLVAAMEGVATERHALRWIGWPGARVPDDRRAEVTRALDEQYHATPVFLTGEQQSGFYEGFSNSSLWPLLHYMVEHFRYEPAWWDQYEHVNHLFAEKVLADVREGDLVWVHDYQLMRVPGMLRDAMARKEAPPFRIGYFLHTPFPAYEMFRNNPRRDELLRGLVGADQIGFHTFGYLRHFRDALLRGLGIESEMLRVNLGTHAATLGVYPIGINSERFEKALADPAHADRVEKFAAAHEHKRLIVSVERLDYTKGVLQRLDAVDLFLAHCSELESIKFLFVSVPSREGVEEYRELREEIESRIGRINGKYATLHDSPIHFIHGSVEFADLVALYAAAEVAVVTPLVDGMNLVAKEYVACQDGAHGRADVDAPGVLILSEFAGAAEELHSALLVNPYDAEGVADTLRRALEMPPDDRRARMAAMRHRVMTWNAAAWAKSFLSDLESRDARASCDETADGAIREVRDRLRTAATRGETISLFLDYDGTLREIQRDPSAAAPDAAVRRTLDRLAQLPNVRVTLISGRTAANLDAWFGQYPFGLVAEHGAAIRQPGRREWDLLAVDEGMAWKDELLKVLRLYEASTPGSFIEVKRTGLVWHYRRADPEYGAWRARELVAELGGLTANEPVQVRHGKKIVEIVASQATKASAVALIAQRYPANLVLCAGDDATDESMFRLQLSELITIKVGDGPTEARYRLPSPSAFRQFLDETFAGPATGGTRLDDGGMRQVVSAGQRL